jgi:hypothetical protein
MAALARTEKRGRATLRHHFRIPIQSNAPRSHTRASHTHTHAHRHARIAHHCRPRESTTAPSSGDRHDTQTAAPSCQPAGTATATATRHRGVTRLQATPTRTKRHHSSRTQSCSDRALLPASRTRNCASSRWPRAQAYSSGVNPFCSRVSHQPLTVDSSNTRRCTRADTYAAVFSHVAAGLSHKPLGELHVSGLTRVQQRGKALILRHQRPH